MDLCLRSNKGFGREDCVLSVTQIYDSNREASLYQKVYAKATSSGTSVSASKGSVTSVAIPDAYQAAGKSVSLYCKGNNPRGL